MKRLTVFCFLTSALFATAPAHAGLVAQASKLQIEPRRTAPATPAPNQPTSAPAVSETTLTLQDLPAGFEEVPEEVKPVIIAQLEPLKQFLARQNMPLDNFFAFVRPAEKLEVVFGFTGILPNEPEQTKFDATIQQVQQPETQKQFVNEAREKLQGYKGRIELVGLEPIPELSNLANRSTGMRVALKLQEQPIRLDVASFRRNKVGVFAAVMYLNGTQPLVAVKDVASKLDNRILQSRGDRG